MPPVSLEKLANGNRGIIRTIDESLLRVKLLEMGLTLGTEIQVLYRAPFGGPLAIDINGYVLSLRQDEAQLVHVEPVS